MYVTIPFLLTLPLLQFFWNPLSKILELLVKMSNIGTSKGVLEIAKFGLYVSIPIVLMYTFANNSKNIQRFMGNRSYVVYPPEAPRPPSPEEMREMARELARKNNSR